MNNLDNDHEFPVQKHHSPLSFQHRNRVNNAALMSPNRLHNQIDQLTNQLNQFDSRIGIGENGHINMSNNISGLQ